MKTLLIIANCPSDNTRQLRDAVVSGALSTAEGRINIKSCEPQSVDADVVLEADAIILGSTENFGSMAGLIKDFFERIYYPCLSETQGMPIGLYVRAGNDGLGTVTDIGRITTGLRWRLVQEPLVLKGPYQTEFEAQCFELGEAVVAGLDLGIF